MQKNARVQKAMHDREKQTLSRLFIAMAHRLIFLYFVPSVEYNFFNTIRRAQYEQHR